MLWFIQLLILRLSKWSTPFPVFWRRHLQNLRQTALMVQYQDTSAPQRYPDRSPLPYMLRTIAICTSALTVAGGSWYVAVDMTTASDLTAIYNCSAFFAYVFSIFFLRERVRASKVFAVAVAIVGVLIVAYGDVTPAKHGSKSGGGAGGPDSAPAAGDESKNRAMGNVVIGVGSVLYGFYEVLYKWLACPPDGTSPGRSMLFANMFGTCMGLFTLCVLWIPLPILHYTGIEVFELPRGEAAWMMGISVFANAGEFSFLNPSHHRILPLPNKSPPPHPLTKPFYSILRFLPRPHLPHLPCPLLRRRTPHNLPRRPRRPTPPSPPQFTTLRRCRGGRLLDYRGVSCVELGDV